MIAMVISEQMHGPSLCNLPEQYQMRSLRMKTARYSTPRAAECSKT